jgi:hypothetical protein
MNQNNLEYLSSSEKIIMGVSFVKQRFENYLACLMLDCLIFLEGFAYRTVQRSSSSKDPSSAIGFQQVAPNGLE